MLDYNDHSKRANQVNTVPLPSYLPVTVGRNGTGERYEVWRRVQAFRELQQQLSLILASTG